MIRDSERRTETILRPMLRSRDGRRSRRRRERAPPAAQPMRMRASRPAHVLAIAARSAPPASAAVNALARMSPRRHRRADGDGGGGAGLTNRQDKHRFFLVAGHGPGRIRVRGSPPTEVVNAAARRAMQSMARGAARSASARHATSRADGTTLTTSATGEGAASARKHGSTHGRRRAGARARCRASRQTESALRAGSGSERTRRRARLSEKHGVREGDVLEFTSFAAATRMLQIATLRRRPTCTCSRARCQPKDILRRRASSRASSKRKSLDRERASGVARDPVRPRTLDGSRKAMVACSRRGRRSSAGPRAGSGIGRGLVAARVISRTRLADVGDAGRLCVAGARARRLLAAYAATTAGGV